MKYAIGAGTLAAALLAGLTVADAQTGFRLDRGVPLPPPRPSTFSESTRLPQPFLYEGRSVAVQPLSLGSTCSIVCPGFPLVGVDY